MALRKKMYDHPRSIAARKAAAKDGEGNDMPETKEDFYKDHPVPDEEEHERRRREWKQHDEDVKRGRVKPDPVIDLDTPEGREELKRITPALPPVRRPRKDA